LAYWASWAGGEGGRLLLQLRQTHTRLQGGPSGPLFVWAECRFTLFGGTRPKLAIQV
jgi:hypothetical protein